MRRLSEDEKEKYRIAGQLGLLEKLKSVGWAGLTPQESGRIGGLMSARKRAARKE